MTLPNDHCLLCSGCYRSERDYLVVHEHSLWHFGLHWYWSDDAGLKFGAVWFGLKFGAPSLSSIYHTISIAVSI